VDATGLPQTALAELKELLSGFPGEVDVVVELRTSVGCRRLRLGPEFRVARSAGLHAELDSLFGEALAAELRPPASAPEGPPHELAAEALGAA
jgi:hypothetical protein